MLLQFDKDGLPIHRRIYQVDESTILYCNNVVANRLYVYASIRFSKESFRYKKLILTSKFFTIFDNNKDEAVSRFRLEYPKYCFSGYDDPEAFWSYRFNFPVNMEKITKHNTNFFIAK